MPNARLWAPALALAAIAAAGVGLWACAHARGERGPRSMAPAEAPVEDTPPATQDIQVGYATWYGRAFAGHRTASGERFDPARMTAAHRTLPFGTWVEVRRVDTGESVRVRVTDRGPFGHEDRIIDLSQAAAEKIGLTRAGMTRVEVRVIPAPPD
jgi:rare lipoprotein A